MVKNLLISVSVLGYFLFKLFFPDGLVMTPSCASSASPGEEITYELTVAKPGISGFAKIQMQLPEGYTAEQIETKNASFSSVGGTVKFIWMSLPPEDEFTISYKLKVADNASGDQQITGKFSFLENNVKSTKEIPATTISILGGNEMASNDTPTTEEENSQPEETETSETNETSTPAESTPTESTPTETPSNQVSETAENTNVSGTRKITTVSPGKYKVVLNIVNDGLTGFAKAQDVLPEGALAYEENANSAVYSFTNRKVKFVWMSLPTENNIEIAYTLVTSNPDDLANITGTFTYLNNNESTKVNIKTIEMPSQDGATTAIAENTTPEPAEEPTPEVEEPTTPAQDAVVDEPISREETAVSEEPVIEERPAVEQPTRREETASSNPTPTPEPAPTRDNTNSNGVNYKVQIMATKGNVSSDVQGYFKRTYSFTEEKVNMESHEGWSKFTIGSHGNYKSARDRRNQVTSGYNFPGPFVTAYVNGRRTTVQDALMVGREKWTP